jgi:hypothetical protein
VTTTAANTATALRTSVRLTEFSPRHRQLIERRDFHETAGDAADQALDLRISVRGKAVSCAHAVDRLKWTG